MTDDPPDRPQSGGLVQALQVPRNATLGVLAGVGLAVVVYLFRVLELLGPFAGTRQYPVIGAEGWFLLLAFVLASATALLVTALLTVVSAYRLSREF
ncbi:DUF7536 family protein [Salinigranum salinum]|uniref:DUF7536 family protein n=1 Tax=Salinigranum salinum TaxID=1364937 RepID=UPI0012611335|nr:hypothetical protein [Salinigranum salinum]